MRWDAVLTGAVAFELDRRLKGARLRSILLDRPGRTAVLYFREATLELRFRGPEITLGLGEAMEPPPEARPLASKLRGVDTIPGDRVLRLHLQRLRGKAESPILVAELTGAHGNVVLVGRTSERVVSVLFQREGGRSLRPGHPYSPLTPPDRPGVESDPPEDVPLADRAWVSPLNRDALAELAAADPEGAQSLWRRLAEAGRLGIAEAGGGTETLGPGSADLSAVAPGVMDPGTAPQPYPVPLPGRAWEESESLLAALAGVAAAAPYVPAAVLQGLERDLKAATKTLRSLTREMERLPDPADLRGKADLLLARAGEVPRGVEVVELTDFEGNRVEVRLDPRQDGPTNARKLYDEAARAERAGRDMPARLEAAQAAVQEATGRLEAARAGEVPEDVERSSSPAGAPAQAPLPYRVYITSGGLEVRVGRGARKNDDLTFRHARPMDVWMHARGVPGAHVVLRWTREEKPPARDLEEAAGLAALYSKARHSSSVPVDWTRRKHVRKPRKAAPGSVLPDRVETVFVDPDPELLDRLSEGS